MPSGSTGAARALVAASAVSALLLAIAFRPAIAADDAAISFRYAERIATGQGFTYNDGQRVLGASNPLYVLTLAVAAKAGAALPSAAFAINLCAYVVAVGLAVWLAIRLGGLPAGGLAAMLLCAEGFSRYQTLSGLEVGLAAALGLGAIAAVLLERWGLAGVLVGLALTNKLDAAALAAAIVLPLLLTRQGGLARVLAGMAAGFLPWILWSAVYFGSFVPHSLVVKLAGGEQVPFDRSWVLRFLRDPQRHLVLWLALAGGFGWLRWPRPRSGGVARACLAGWAAIHVGAYSLVDLGAPYPWYVALPVLPLTVLAADALGRSIPALEERRRWSALAVMSLAWVAVLMSVRDIARAWPSRSEVLPWEAFDADRRLAGAFLRDHAEPGEILGSAHGWPAFESKLSVFDLSRLNESDREAPAMTYRVEHGVPAMGGSVPRPPEGMIPLVTFNLASSRDAAFSWFVLFGRPDSAVARAGVRALRYRPRELEDGQSSFQPVSNDVVVRAGGRRVYRLPDGPPPSAILFTLPALQQRAPGAVRMAIGLDDRVLWRGAPDAASVRRVCVPVGPAMAPATTLVFSSEGSAEATFGDAEIAAGQAALPIEVLSGPLQRAWQQHGLIGDPACAGR